MARRYKTSLAAKPKKRFGVTLMQYRTQNRDAVLWRRGQAEQLYHVSEIDRAMQSEIKLAAGERAPTTLELWDDRQAHVMTRIHRDKWTEQRVAEELGVNQSTVNRIALSALKACRKAGGYCHPLWKNI